MRCLAPSDPVISCFLLLPRRQEADGSLAIFSGFSGDGDSNCNYVDYVVIHEVFNT